MISIRAKTGFLPVCYLETDICVWIDFLDSIQIKLKEDMKDTEKMLIEGGDRKTMSALCKKYEASDQEATNAFSSMHTLKCVISEEKISTVTAGKLIDALNTLQAIFSDRLIGQGDQVSLRRRDGELKKYRILEMLKSPSLLISKLMKLNRDDELQVEIIEEKDDMIN